MQVCSQVADLVVRSGEFDRCFDADGFEFSSVVLGCVVEAEDEVVASAGFVGEHYWFSLSEQFRQRWNWHWQVVLGLFLSQVRIAQVARLVPATMRMVAMASIVVSGCDIRFPTVPIRCCAR